MVILEAPAEPRSLELKGMNTKDENLEAKINKKKYYHAHQKTAWQT